jgi:15-cis-phytoene synthase
LLNADVVTAARDGEPDRYLAALLAPADVRDDLMAIAAFAADMRRVPRLVKEPMMGEVRLQWWRDSIASFEQTGSSGHAVADALSAAVRRHRLPLGVLVAMTEARAFDLYDDPMADDAALTGYLAKTEAAPFALALQILHVEAPDAIADAAGRAYGLMRLLTGLPHALARGRVPLPRTLLQETNTSLDDLLHGNPTSGVRALVGRLERDSLAAVKVARTLARGLSRAQRTALLPLATIPTYLRAANAGQSLRTIGQPLPFARVWRIARAHWLGL